jgi:hypothetical protein
MAVSTELATKVIEQLVGGKDFTAPKTWYFGLLTGAPVNGMIPDGYEPSSSNAYGYKRIALPNTQDVFTTAITGSSDGNGMIAYVTNKDSFDMSEVTSGSEPEVNYFFLAETEQNSNESGADKRIAMWGQFDMPRKLLINSTLVISAGGAIFGIYNTNGI